MSSWEHMGADGAVLNDDRSATRWIYLKRGVRLKPGEMVFEHMIERRRWVLVWRRLRSAIGLAWFRLRWWVAP